MRPFLKQPYCHVKADAPLTLSVEVREDWVALVGTIPALGDTEINAPSTVVALTFCSCRISATLEAVVPVAPNTACTPIDATSLGMDGNTLKPSEFQKEPVVVVVPWVDEVTMSVPAGIGNPFGGEMAAGELANEGTFIAALKEVPRDSE